MNEENAEVNTEPARSAVRSTDWLAALKRHVADMRAREESTRSRIKELQLTADAIQTERMELQNLISTTERS